MKLTKTQWIIVAVVGAVAIWYFLLRKKDETKESGYIGQKLDGRATVYRKNLESGYVNIDGANAWIANCVQQYISNMSNPDDFDYQSVSEICMSKYNQRKGGTAIKADKSKNQ